MPGIPRVPVLLLILPLALVLLNPAAARAEEGDAEEALALLLSKARFQEKTEHNHAQALAMYEDLLQHPALEPQMRGEALLGRARCLVVLERPEEARETWDQILSDPALPIAVRDQAEKERDRLIAQRSAVDEEALREEAFQRLQEKRREEARSLLEQARRALDEGRHDLARQLCLDAKNLLPENPEADLLLQRINQAMPDRGDLLRQLLRFADTTHAQSFRYLKSEVERLARDGIDQYKADSLEAAAGFFRDAIRRIDESEFLPDLLAEREYLLTWLRRVLEEGGKRGLELGAEPPYPDPASTASSWRRRFYDLLSEVFTVKPEEEEPLVLYDARPASLPPDVQDATLVAGPFPRGMSATRTEGSLGRAAWAEAWIRANVGTGWGETHTDGVPPRVLDRFGDVLIVQNNRAAHRKVEELLSGFAAEGAPVAVDVAVLAATTPGGTALAARLGLQARPRDAGRDLVVSNRLFEESLEAVRILEGVQVLGSARLLLPGRPTATIQVTQRSEHHPVFDQLPAPPLVLTEEESRYGLALEIYAENLSRAPGAPRGALGVVATTQAPSGSIVVPKPNAAGDWMRIPRPFPTQRENAYRIVEHTGTLVMQGLANPFPESARDYPGLVLLLGVRPAGGEDGRVPVPDPPRPVAAAPAGSGPEEREYPLGALASAEVVDEMLAAGWPRRPMAVPVPAAVARKARERYLSTQLGGTWSGLAAPGQPSPVVVQGETATAALPPEGHQLLQGAVERLRRAEAALYEVDVLTTELTEGEVADWVGQSGARAFTPGTYLATTAAGEQALDQRMRAQGAAGGLYTLQARLLARATQKVAAHNLRTVSIIDDIRFWRGANGVMRYIPVPGLAEEGIVVLVRPELDADGRRLVTVEAQAARLSSLERILLPSLELSAARVTVPRHFPTQARQLAAPLADEEAAVLTLPAPEGSGRVVLVKVRVRRIQ